MILELSYEEVTALNSAAERIRGGGGVAAPPEAMAALDRRLPLQGDIEVDGLDGIARLLDALDAVLEHLGHRMDTLVLEQYVGADDPVNAYFDYAHVLTVRHRLREIGRGMEAMDDLFLDAAPDSDTGGEDAETPAGPG